MTVTLLLDLDDTLLGNQIDTFIPYYTRSLGKHFTSVVNPELLVKQLMAATGYMLSHQRFDHTLQENFDSVFYPAIGLSKVEAKPLLDDFYNLVFPTLQQYTQTIPTSATLLKTAFHDGLQVAIATNPLFPRTAIVQRLKWAGADPQQFPFAIIPDYETFHFTKPNPAFFAELLAYLDWPSGPFLMVGDSLENDITAARQMSLSAFWISNDDQRPLDGPWAPDAVGTLADVLPWLEIADLPLPDFHTPQAALAILKSTPAVLHSLRTHVPVEEWLKPPGPDEWCLAEIVCHLRDVEAEVNLPRLQKVIEENNPFLVGVDTDPWADQRQYKAQDCLQALEDFFFAREKTIVLLEQQSQADWQRTARHSMLGPTRLQELIDITAAHDRLHVQQIHKVLRLNQTHLSHGPSLASNPGGWG